jgi:hypothetical protein
MSAICFEVTLQFLRTANICPGTCGIDDKVAIRKGVILVEKHLGPD